MLTFYNILYNSKSEIVELSNSNIDKLICHIFLSLWTILTSQPCPIVKCSIIRMMIGNDLCDPLQRT